MRCTQPIRLMHLNKLDYPDGLLVPCGKCLACRIAKRTEWSMRMLHELDSYRDACFITLTYDMDNLPPNGSLDKAELQKFWKRLRKSLGDRKIRYFACGEYGDKFGRPHYHAIVFGLSLRPCDRQLVRNAWRHGLCHFGLAQPDSIRYVAQYVDKKYTGDLSRQVYEATGREPVFKVSSLGLGREYVERNRTQLVQQSKCTVNGVDHSLPRYYLDKLGDAIDRNALKDAAVLEAADEYGEITGLYVDPDVAYHVRPAAEYTQYATRIRNKRQHKQDTLQAKVDIKHSKSNL